MLLDIQKSLTCRTGVFRGFPKTNPRNVMFTANTALWGVHFWEPLKQAEKAYVDPSRTGPPRSPHNALSTVDITLWGFRTPGLSRMHARAILYFMKLAIRSIFGHYGLQCFTWPPNYQGHAPPAPSQSHCCPGFATSFETSSMKN